MTSRDFLSVGSQQVNSDRFTEKKNSKLQLSLFASHSTVGKKQDPRSLSYLMAGKRISKKYNPFSGHI
jgi:hypothetical protein